PEDVRLVWNEEVTADQGSRLRGVVRDVVLLPEGRLVAVDVGQIVWARLSHEEAELLRVERGQAVTCLVKADALFVVRNGNSINEFKKGAGEKQWPRDPPGVSG